MLYGTILPVTKAPARAAIYARQSKGNPKSVDQQIEAAQEACDERGWAVHDTYIDYISASRFESKSRKDWARLLTALDAGEFGVVVLWESSRGDRRASSWMVLLDNCRDLGVLIHVTDDGRTYDLNIETDWEVLASSGVRSQAESEKTSRRIKRDVRSNAKKGRPHGGLLYGYQRIYQLEKGKRALVAQKADPDRAPVVKEIITRIAGGEAVSAVQHDLNRRGIKPARGEEWNRASIRSIAMDRAYIGYRRYHKRWIKSEEWFPPLIDEVTFWQARNRLTDPSRKTPRRKTSKPKVITRPGSAVHLLSYLAVCGVCSSPVSVYPRKTYTTYRCRRGCASIRQEWLDAYVTGHLCARLNTPAFWDELEHGSDADAQKAQAEADELRDLIRDYQQQAIAERIPADTFTEVAEGLHEQLAAAEQRAGRRTISPLLTGIGRTNGLAQIRKQFEGKPMEVRREIIRGLYKKVTVLPAGLSRSVPDRERVKMVPVPKKG